MDTASSFLEQHPATWIMLMGIGALIVMRVLARLACLAASVVAFLILVIFAGAIMKGVA